MARTLHGGDRVAAILAGRNTHTHTLGQLPPEADENISAAVVALLVYTR